jgi:NAD(P)-dependent dehydrogenase (short-subunit alcohol dehydrogenase family)
MTTYVITGANRGIGLAMAQQLSDRGDRVIAVCRSASEELEAPGITVEAEIDVTRAEDLAELRRRLSDLDIDVLINNAGLLRSSSFTGVEAELDDWRAQYEVNALAPIRVSAALSERLARGGKVVIITSRMGSMTDNSSGGAFAYRMSKAAVNAAGVSLAHELEPREIAVGLLHPGYVRTGMTGMSGHIDSDEAARNLIERIDELDMSLTGSFRHANGEELPW